MNSLSSAREKEGRRRALPPLLPPLSSPHPSHFAACRDRPHNSSASRSEDWWKLLSTGRPGFRGTCAVFRDERTTRPATATRVSEVTPLCLFHSHGQASFSGRPPSSRYFNHHLRRSGTHTDILKREQRRQGRVSPQLAVLAPDRSAITSLSPLRCAMSWVPASTAAPRSSRSLTIAR